VTDPSNFDRPLGDTVIVIVSQLAASSGWRRAPLPYLKFWYYSVSRPALISVSGTPAVSVAARPPFGRSMLCTSSRCERILRSHSFFFVQLSLPVRDHLPRVHVGCVDKDRSNTQLTTIMMTKQRQFLMVKPCSMSCTGLQGQLR